MQLSNLKGFAKHLIKEMMLGLFFTDLVGLKGISRDQDYLNYFGGVDRLEPDLLSELQAIY